MGTHDPASAKQSKATSSLLLSQPVSTPMLQVQAASVPTVASVQGLQAPIQPTLASSSQSVSAPVPQVPTLPNAVSNASGVLLLPSQALAPTATLYNAKRPMDDAHYQAREAKHKAWEQRATQLTESRAKTELLKTTIDIVYWRNATDIPDFLTIPCPSFPTFSLSECSSTTRSMLGIEDDFNKFIPTFDPNRERWVNHTAMTPRDISLHRMLLYRAPTIRCDSAPDMQTAIDEVMALHTKSTSSRKRPAPTTVSTQPLKRMKVDGSPSTVVSEGGIATTPPVAVVKKESVETGTLHRVQQLPKKVKVKPSAVEVLVIDDEELAGTSSSAHGRWPLKYYKAMASGFERIDTMTGPVHARFTAVFGEIDNIKFPSPRTYYKSYAAWDSASPALKEQYLKAGYTDEGLWKHFVRDVRKCFPDGNIPNLLARYGKGKGKGKNSTSEPMDWDGVGEIVVKAEPGVDVLPQVKQEPTEAVFKSDAREIIEISDDE
ncbi:hypothetical protein CPC08DRAFT_717549 [Agrocybe pediades]|nr:hypothetical protein CPC08DRAFT_717549 [Agrocybe pediades]